MQLRSVPIVRGGLVRGHSGVPGGQDRVLCDMGREPDEYFHFQDR